MIESFPTAFANSLWQGALLSLAVWFVLRHLTRFSAATRLAIWQVTLAVVLLLPALRQLPAISLFEAPPVARVSPSASSPIAAPEEPLTVPVHRPLIEVDNHGPAELFAPLAAILALLQLLRLAAPGDPVPTASHPGGGVGCGPGSAAPATGRRW